MCLPINHSWIGGILSIKVLIGINLIAVLTTFRRHLGQVVMLSDFKWFYFLLELFLRHYLTLIVSQIVITHVLHFVCLMGYLRFRFVHWRAELGCLFQLSLIRTTFMSYVVNSLNYLVWKLLIMLNNSVILPHVCSSISFLPFGSYVCVIRTNTSSGFRLGFVLLWCSSMVVCILILWILCALTLSRMYIYLSWWLATSLWNKSCINLIGVVGIGSNKWWKLIRMHHRANLILENDILSKGKRSKLLIITYLFRLRRGFQTSFIIC